MRRIALLAVLLLALLVTTTTPTRLAESIDADILGYTPRGLAIEHTFLVSSIVTRWDPCTPIGWRINTLQARRGALSDTQAAFWRLGQITGFTFRYRGHTALIPQWDGNERYPADTQIVVAWIRQGQSSLFDTLHTASGVGLPHYLTGYHDTAGITAWRIDSGGVVIDKRVWLRGGFGWGLTRGDLLLHELGHVMGLGHYPSTDEAMNPVITRGPARYGRGDIAGLEERGARLGCLYAD